MLNIGSTEEVSIRELAERVIARSGDTSPIKLIPYVEAYEPGFEDRQRRVPDTTKLHALTGWEPTLSLDDILTEMIMEAPAERRRGQRAARTGTALRP